MSSADTIFTMGRREETKEFLILLTQDLTSRERKEKKKY